MACELNDIYPQFMEGFFLGNEGILYSPRAQPKVNKSRIHDVYFSHGRSLRTVM